MLSSRERAAKWKAPDLIMMAVVSVLNILVYRFKPFERQFYVNDLSISHPYAEKQRVSDVELAIYALVVPFVAILAYCLVFRFNRNPERYFLLWISLLGLLVTLNVTALVTNYLKNWFGRPRPDFLSRCIPKKDTPENVLVYAKDVCTTTDLELLYEGYRSCPSGHSSESFSGLGYLYYFLAGQLRADLPANGFYRKLICYIPLMGAAVIALSRTQDYRHHFTDVFLGSFLGFLLSREVYRHYFSLDHESAYAVLPYGSDHMDNLTSLTSGSDSYNLLENPQYGQPVADSGGTQTSEANSNLASRVV